MCSVESWWSLFKDNAYWSGAIVGLDWDELWPEAQENLRFIYDVAVGDGNDH